MLYIYWSTGIMFIFPRFSIMVPNHKHTHTPSLKAFDYALITGSKICKISLALRSPKPFRPIPKSLWKLLRTAPPNSFKQKWPTKLIPVPVARFNQLHLLLLAIRCGYIHAWGTPKHPKDLFCRHLWRNPCIWHISLLIWHAWHFPVSRLGNVQLASSVNHGPQRDMFDMWVKLFRASKKWPKALVELLGCSTVKKVRMIGNY